MRIRYSIKYVFNTDFGDTIIFSKNSSEEAIRFMKENSEVFLNRWFIGSEGLEGIYLYKNSILLASAYILDDTLSFIMHQSA